MSIRVATMESLLRHYRDLLEESKTARKVVESLGLNADAEVMLCRDLEGILVGWLERGFATVDK